MMRSSSKTEGESEVLSDLGVDALLPWRFCLRSSMTVSASRLSADEALDDCLICGGAACLCRGVENAPVDWRWRASYISCSSLGRRCGDGPEAKCGKEEEGKLEDDADVGLLVEENLEEEEEKE